MLDKPKLAQLKAMVEHQPDATLEELRQRLREQAHVEPSLTTVCRALQALDLRRKQKRFFARERDPKKRKQFLSAVVWKCGETAGLKMLSSSGSVFFKPLHFKMFFHLLRKGDR